MNKAKPSNKESGSDLAVLSRLVVKAAELLDRPEHRFILLLLGVGLGFTLALVGLGTVVMARGVQSFPWLVVLIPTALVIVLTVVYLLFLHRTQIPRTAACTSELAERLRPCEEIEACWPERGSAEQDMIAATLDCKSSLFIAGVCLNTMGTILGRADVITHLAERLRTNPHFAITIITIGSPDDLPKGEEGRGDLHGNFASGRESLKRFRKHLTSQMADQDKERVNFRRYTLSSFPRHFILQADDKMYVGSYLCHREGALSYLLRLTYGKSPGGLYNLFQKEVTYLEDKHNSEPLDITSITT